MNDEHRRMLKVTLFMMALICAFVCFLYTINVHGDEKESDHPVCSELESEWVCEPLPVCEWTQEDKPKFDEETLVLVGRLSRGIKKFSKRRGGGQWWECGIPYDEDQANDASLEWAWQITKWTDEWSDDGTILNPWGIAGVFGNESGFDRCAMGKWPRKWAYDTKRLKKNRRSLSHKAEDLVRIISSPEWHKRWNRTGFDWGPGQELWKCNEKGCRSRFWSGDRRVPFEDMVKLPVTMDSVVREFRRRSRFRSTDRPWLYWRGYRCKWYDDKITRIARQLGARKDEI